MIKLTKEISSYDKPTGQKIKVTVNPKRIVCCRLDACGLNLISLSDSGFFVSESLSYILAELNLVEVDTVCSPNIGLANPTVEKIYINPDHIDLFSAHNNNGKEFVKILMTGLEFFITGTVEEFEEKLNRGDRNV